MSSLSCRDIAQRVLGDPQKVSRAELYYTCPNHEDRHPSLQINTVKDKWMCGPCDKGGGPWTLAAFLARLHSNESKAIAKWLHETFKEGYELPHTERPTNLDYKRVAEYYYSATMRNVRSEAENPTGKPYKRYHWERFDPGKQVWVVGGTRAAKPLYTNKLFRESDTLNTVYGFEGENKCEEAGKVGLPAFSFKYLSPEECEKLAGLEVILWPDYDKPGFDLCKTACETLLKSKQPRAIRVIRPPADLPVGGDIVDAVRDYGLTHDQAVHLGLRSTEYPPPEKPIGIRLDTVRPEESDWLWLKRIPVGSITLLDGDPGTGKSMLSLEIAARISRGDELPDNGQPHAPANVILLSSEDSLTQTLVPRLQAARANLTRIVSIPYAPSKPGEITFSRLPGDLKVLERAIREYEARLVVFDVLVSYIPTELSTSRDQDVRTALAPLAELGERTGCAFLGTRHLNKTKDTNALYRGGGSIALVGAARAALLLARDPTDENTRVLAVTKSNLGTIPNSVTFTIETTNHVPLIRWGASSRYKSGMLLEPRNEDDEGTLRDAVDFLESVLTSGPASAKDIEQSAKENLISKRTLARAKAKLGVRSYRTTSCGPWYWERRQNPSPPTTDTLGTLGG